ncbi:MAG: ABC transporter permease [Deltaproteobacteria bacterium]|nr:ABC transporter permease [Deltaproteobacteria bacterium]
MMQKTEGMAGDVRRERDVLRLVGDWTLPHYRLLKRKLEKIPANFTRIDFSGLGALDTAGASLLAWRLGEERLKALIEAAPELSSERRALLLAVGAAAGRPVEAVPAPSRTLGSLLAGIGKCVIDGIKGLGALLNFAGLTLVSLVRVLPHPKRWRLVSLVSHVQQTGLNAVPIVALLTFLVGAVVAFLGATVLAIFGATIYTVDLVAYAFEREFGVLLAAILLAGRTASAFTAQVGSMKVNEEIDALQAQGLDPMEMLVLPRVLALLISLPLLTFVAVVSGMVGGAVVAVFSLDISLARYLDIIQTVHIQHFLTGIAKAPVFAFVIAIIGCLEGFKVEGSARSVGAHTTSSVVQSIFMVILLDAIAAMFFMEMKW